MIGFLKDFVSEFETAIANAVAVQRFGHAARAGNRRILASIEDGVAEAELEALRRLKPEGVNVGDIFARIRRGERVLGLHPRRGDVEDAADTEIIDLRVTSSRDGREHQRAATTTMAHAPLTRSMSRRIDRNSPDSPGLEPPNSAPPDSTDSSAASVR